MSIEFPQDTAAPEAGAAAPRDRFARLSVAVKDLSAARSHDAIIDITRQAAREITGALGVAIVLRDGDRCHYIAEDSAVPLWSGQKFPLTACISGWAMLNREQVVIPDIYIDDRIPHEAYRPTGIHSLIMTPVGEPAPFGALGAYWRDIRKASRDEIASMAALASCMATALENIDHVASLRAEADHKQMLINELNHRVKNTLAIVQGLSIQSLRNAVGLEAGRADFSARLMALSGAHNLMTEVQWRAVDMGELLDRTLAPFVSRDGGSPFDVAGPEIRLPSKAAVAFALAIHELCTNAAKHGALSAPGGRVALSWALAGEDRFRLTWRETGGPPVTPPAARGFGSRLLERGLAGELRGTVKLDFRPDGLVCEMDLAIPEEEEGLFPLPGRPA